MTVSDLIELLQAFPGETQVVMSADAEGNAFSPLDEAELARYLPDSTWSGELVDDWEDDPDDKTIPAVFLWPVN